MASLEAGGQDETEDLCLPLPRLAEVSFAYAATSLSFLTDEALHTACGTRVCFTSRLGGTSTGSYASLNLSGDVGDAPDAVWENRQRLFACADAAGMADELIVPKQVHGDEVLVVEDVEETQALARRGADGIVCTRSGVPVLLCFADCTPVILVAPGGAFSVLHAGWRGALAGIAGKGLSLLAAQAGCDPAQCNAYIGPHIGPCCYEVSEELLERFVDAYGRACEAGARRLDLSAAVTASLVRAGAAPERIADASICTACAVSTYYSYRAEDGCTGRHGALAFREAISWD